MQQCANDLNFLKDLLLTLQLPFLFILDLTALLSLQCTFYFPLCDLQDKQIQNFLFQCTKFLHNLICIITPFKRFILSIIIFYNKYIFVN